MVFQGFQKAVRRQARLRLGVAGASGSGKSVSALLIAYGLTGDWGKIGVIDSENNSASLYAPTDDGKGTKIGAVEIGAFLTLPLSAPYTPQRYVEAIKSAEAEGSPLEVLIIDSLTHAWSGEGGVLDRQGKLADRGQNSFTAWRTITPEHNALVEAMLQSKLHVIATLRTKAEYVLETSDKGKQVPKKVGMAPIQRDGMEYEFTTFFELDQKHVAMASKDRTNLFDNKFFVPTTDTGKLLREWLESGGPEVEAALAPPPQAAPEPKAAPKAAPEAAPDDKHKAAREVLAEVVKSRGDLSNAEVSRYIETVYGVKGSKNLTVEQLKELTDAVLTEKVAEQSLLFGAEEVQGE